jgi:hypothetical protein
MSSAVGVLALDTETVYGCPQGAPQGRRSLLA